MSVFFSYILLGLSLSAPMGPINAAQLDKGIRYGFFHAWLVGMGAMAADAIFMICIYFGLAQLIMIPIIKSFLWLFGFFVLGYTGVESIIYAKSAAARQTVHPHETKGRSFRTGFFMAIANPLNILFWLGIYGSILAQTASSYDTHQLLIYSTGIFIGILIWDVAMAGAATGAKKWLKPRVLQGISVISGLVLIGFGLYFGIQAGVLLFG